MIDAIRKVEEMQADITTVDTVADGIQTDLSNATDGLGALKILIDACNTTTPPTVAQIRAEMEGAGYNLALILADTDELQTDWKIVGRLDLIIDAILLDTSTTLDAKITAITTALAVHDQNVKSILFSEVV